MSTQSDYLVTATVDGRPLGVFDSRSGGEVDSDIAKRNTGEGPKVYNGRPNVGDVTIVRGYERERDHELIRTLEKRVGRAEVVISEQPLDEDDNPWGKPKIWTGKLKTVTGGDVDADSSDPRDFELTIVAKAVN